MTGNASLFNKLKAKDGGKVTFGDNNKAKTIGIGNIGTQDSSFIKNVLLVDNLNYNLLSVSQLCDMGLFVIFKRFECLLLDSKYNLVARGKRQNDIYVLIMNKKVCDNVCLNATSIDAWLWHRRLCHFNMDVLENLAKKELVRGLPNLKYSKDKICDACQYGKQIKISFKSKNVVSTTKPLELLHLDLFGPTQNASLGGSRYVFVIVDDYSRYTWVLFLIHKNEAFKLFTTTFAKVQNLLDLKIIRLRSDNGTEFKNSEFVKFCDYNGIMHEFSTPRVPQQNGVVERKNRTLQETARTLLSENDLPKYFWAEAVNTSCYVMNRVLLRPILNITPYELIFNKKTNCQLFQSFWV